MMEINIPREVRPPTLTSQEINEVTNIVFGAEVTPNPCDVIFVFGTTQPEVYDATAAAYKAGLGATIIITGGRKPNVNPHSDFPSWAENEAEVIKKELEKRGVPANTMRSENRSTNSLENVLFALDILNFNEITSVLAVCKTYAVGRQCRTLKKHLPETVNVIPFTYETMLKGSTCYINRDNWTANKETHSYIWGMILKIIEYGKRGHLVPLSRISDSLRQKVESSIANLI
jgi:uncharacterized SAM-binding protein YcdF (DUF218 family)